MPSRFDPEPNPNQPQDDGKVDLTKRYDVYVWEYGTRAVVYRNVRFLRARTLISMAISQVIELEQPNGQSVFIGRHSILRFCEHGTDVSVEIIDSK